MINELTGAVLSMKMRPAGHYITARNHPARKWLENANNKWAAFSQLPAPAQLTMMSERSRVIPPAFISNPKVTSLPEILIGRWTVRPESFDDLGEGRRVFDALVTENLINRKGELRAGAVFPEKIRNPRLRTSLGGAFDNVIATIAASQSWKPDEPFVETVMKAKPNVLPEQDYARRIFSPEAVKRLMATALDHSCGDVFQETSSLVQDSLSIGSVFPARRERACSTGTVGMLRGIDVESLIDRPLICLAIDLLEKNPPAQEEYRAVVGVNPLLHARFTKILSYVAFWN